MKPTLSVILSFPLEIALFILMVAGCNSAAKDKRNTPSIFSAHYEGTFSTRTFELKIDSTFKFSRNLSGNRYIVDGVWTKQNDTFFLHAPTGKDNYGAIVARGNQSIFLWNSHDSTLIDMNNSNFRIAHHDPPKKIRFRVR